MIKKWAMEIRNGGSMHPLFHVFTIVFVWTIMHRVGVEAMFKLWAQIAGIEDGPLQLPPLILPAHLHQQHHDHDGIPDDPQPAAQGA